MGANTDTLMIDRHDLGRIIAKVAERLLPEVLAELHADALGPEILAKPCGWAWKYLHDFLEWVEAEECRGTDWRSASIPFFIPTVSEFLRQPEATGPHREAALEARLLEMKAWLESRT